MYYSLASMNKNGGLFFGQYLVVHCCAASLLSAGAPRSYELLWLQGLTRLLTNGPHAVGPVGMVDQVGVPPSVEHGLCPGVRHLSACDRGDTGREPQVNS